MSTIIPEKQAVKNAIKWISEQQEQEAGGLNKLIFAAISKFDLNPKDSDFLINFYKSKSQGS